MGKAKYLILVVAFLLGTGLVKNQVGAQEPPADPPADDTTPVGETFEMCTARNLSEYMNAVIEGTRGLNNIRLLSPAFNFTNPSESLIYSFMAQPVDATLEPDLVD